MGAGAKLALVADADIGRKVFQRRAHHRLLLHDALPATLHLGLLRQRRHPSLVLGHVVADDAVVVVGVDARRANPRLPRLALRPIKLALRALRLRTQLRLRDLGPGGIKLSRLGRGQLRRLLLRTAHRQRRHGQRRRLQRFGRRRRGQRQVVRVAGAILQLGHLALIVAGRLALVRRCRGGLLPSHVLHQVPPVVLRVLGGAVVLLGQKARLVVVVFVGKLLLLHHLQVGNLLQLQRRRLRLFRRLGLGRLLDPLGQLRRLFFLFGLLLGRGRLLLLGLLRQLLGLGLGLVGLLRRRRCLVGRA